MSFFKDDKEEIILAQKNLDMVIRQLIKVRAAASTVQSVDASSSGSEEEEGVEEPFCDVQEAEVNAETTVQFDSSYTAEDDDDVRVRVRV